MARPFRLFSVYDFFSVLLPGLATVLGFYMLIPKPIEIGIVAALLPILVLSFVFGQALHSLSAWFEAILNRTRLVSSHRTQFGDYIHRNADNHVVQKFREDCAYEFRDSGLINGGQGGVSKEAWKDLYPYIQSHIYTNDAGRSRTFQAIFAFSRSMTVFLFGLPLLYLLHFFLDSEGMIISRPPKYLLFFPSFREFIEAVWPLSWLGMLVFLYATYSYKQYFVQYLVSDFVSINS